MLTKTCTKCGLIKSISDLAVRSKKLGTHKNYCKVCDNARRSLSYFNNHERELEYHSNKYVNNREYIIARNSKYQADNKANTNRNQNKRRAKKLNATPKWLTEEDYSQITAIYKACYDLTELTGIQFHVDHIVPLQGSQVSGLHSPINLQILEASANLSKSNKYGGN